MARASHAKNHEDLDERLREQANALRHLTSTSSPRNNNINNDVYAAFTSFTSDFKQGKNDRSQVQKPLNDVYIFLAYFYLSPLTPRPRQSEFE